MSADLTHIRDIVSHSEPGMVVLELHVIKSNRYYRMVGVCMQITDTQIRIAFNAKNGQVMDDVDFPLESIYTARIVPDAEIALLE